jgi:hypothetical protein
LKSATITNTIGRRIINPQFRIFREERNEIELELRGNSNNTKFGSSDQTIPVVRVFNGNTIEGSDQTSGHKKQTDFAQSNTLRSVLKSTNDRTAFTKKSALWFSLSSSIINCELIWRQRNEFARERDSLKKRKKRAKDSEVSLSANCLAGVRNQTPLWCEISDRGVRTAELGDSKEAF